MLIDEKKWAKLLQLSIYALFLFTPFLCSRVLATSKASLLKMTSSNILTLWITAIILFGIAQGYVRQLKIPMPVPLYFIYLLYSIILYLTHKNFGANIYEFNKLLLFVLIILFPQFVSLKKIITLFHFVFVLVLFYGLLQILGADFIDWSSYNRIFSTFGNPNFYSPYILLFAPLYLVLLYYKRNLIYGLIFILALINIYFTHTRGVYIGTVATILLFGLIELLRVLKIRLKYAAFFIGIIGLALSLYLGIVDRGEHLSFVQNFKGTVRERVLIWQSALRINNTDKFFGFGYGSFKRLFPHYVSMFFTLHEGDPNVVPSYAHNEYVEQLFEVGVLGLALFLLIWLKPVYRLLDDRTKKGIPENATNIIKYGLALGMAGVLLQNAFGVNMRYATTSTYLFFLLGIIAPYRTVKVTMPPQQIKTTIMLVIPVLIVLAAIAVIPILSSTYEQAGNEYDINKNPTNAYQMYKKAYELSHRNDVALYKMGYYMHKYAQKPYKSLSYYKKLMMFSPYYPEVRYTVGTIYYTIKKYAEAYDILMQDLEDVYYNAKTHNNIANIYSEFGKWKYALRHYKAAYHIDPRLHIAYVNAGVIYMEQKMYDRALKELKKAIKINPRYGYAWILLSRVYRKMGNLEKAKEAEQKAELYGGQSEKLRLANSFNEQGKQFFNQKNFQKALEYFKKAIEAKPDARFYNNAGLCYFHLNNLTKAEEYYKKGLLLAPTDRLLLQNLALVYAAQKRYDAEIKIFEKLHRLFPKNKKITESLMIRYRNQGARLFNSGKRKEVIPYWQKYKELGGTEKDILDMLDRLKQAYQK